MPPKTETAGSADQHDTEGRLSGTAVGYSPLVVHGLFESPEVALHVCEESGLRKTDAPILLSIPSFYALEWARKFIVSIKSQYPGRKIIAGGRWVVGNNTKWIEDHLAADLVVPGLVGENILHIVSTGSVGEFIPTPVKELRPNKKFNYDLLYERDLFQPSIMVSSGCGLGCAFCEEANIALSKLKKPCLVAEEMAAIHNSKRLVDATPYLESSMFVATKEWAKQLFIEREKRGVACKWRVESRVDKLKAENVRLLAKAGLKVLDLGLESASHGQLIRMKKTNNPAHYLAAAQELIETAYDNGIWVKVNILLYAGESYRTIDETTKWLSKVRYAIKGVSAGPVVIYGLPGDINGYIEELESYGASTLSTDIVGVTNVSPSREIDHRRALEMSKYICRDFMTAQDYFDLKSFSYFPRNYTHLEFLRDIADVNQDEVSFGL